MRRSDDVGGAGACGIDDRGGQCGGDGAGFTTSAAGQTLAFSEFNVPAGGSVTVVYPALVSTTTPPANGTLLNSDVWVADALSAVLVGGTARVVQPAATAGRQTGKRGADSSSAAQTGATTRQQTGSPAAGAVGATLSADPRITVALDYTVMGDGKSTLDANNHWPNDLGQRLRSEGDTSRPITVQQSGGGTGLPPALEASRVLTELEGNARTQGTPKYIIFLDGIRDEPVTADQVIARHRQIIVQSHALGLKIMGGTIPPFAGTTFFRHTALDEANRAAVNAWIRNSGAYDAVIDFDRATSDPQHPTRLLAAYDTGDHLHPNDTGYKAMANAIDLSLFDE
jgi:lysophospholipase L1-like esterase